MVSEGTERKSQDAIERIAPWPDVQAEWFEGISAAYFCAVVVAAGLAAAFGFVFGVEVFVAGASGARTGAVIVAFRITASAAMVVLPTPSCVAVYHGAGRYHLASPASLR